MGKLRRFLPKLQVKAEDGLAIAAATAIAIMMGLTVVDVVMRHVFGSPIKGVYEYVYLLFVAVVFFGLAYAQRRNDHIQIGILFDRLPRKLRYPTTGVILVLSLGIFALVTWQSGIKALWALEMGDTILGATPVLTWPSRLAVTIGAGLLSIRLLVQLVRLVRRGELIGETAKPTE